MMLLNLTKSVFVYSSDMALSRLCHRLFSLAGICLFLAFLSVWVAAPPVWSGWMILLAAIRVFGLSLPFILWCFFRVRLYLWRRERNKLFY